MSTGGCTDNFRKSDSSIVPVVQDVQNVGRAELYRANCFGGTRRNLRVKKQGARLNAHPEISIMSPEFRKFIPEIQFSSGPEAERYGYLSAEEMRAAPLAV